tara:strand:- start:485 stop:1789 length:1305 start_codon:yes stop_codon:yes gene_type:complete
MQKDYYESLGIFSNVYNLSENFSLGKNFEKEKIKLPEFLSDNIYKYVEYDRHLNKQNIDTINKTIAHHYVFIQKLLKKHNYSFFYGEIAHLHTKLIQEIGARYGMKIVWPQDSQFGNRFFIISGNEHALSDSIKDHYLNVDANAPTEEEINFAKKYINENRCNEDPIKDDYNKDHFHLNDKKVIFSKYKLIYNRIKYKSKGNNDLYAPSLFKIFKDKILNSKFLKFLSNNRLSSLFSNVNKNDKYALFFLHYEPDLSTLVWAPYFKNQIELIKKISFSLPYGMHLYVKEHPLMKDKRKFNYLQEIHKIPQVKLINSVIDSKKLIRHSDFIVTITGTVGWEAIILQKPVIVFGNVFYESYPGIIKFENWTFISKYIKQARDFKIIKDAELIKFITAILRTTYIGDWYKFAVIAVEDEKNTKAVIDAFRAFISRSN